MAHILRVTLSLWGLLNKKCFLIKCLFYAVKNTVENLTLPADPFGQNTCKIPSSVICPLHGVPVTDEYPRNPVKKQNPLTGLYGKTPIRKEASV